MVRNEKIAFLCDYQSYYGGNFIPSLMALEKEALKSGYQCVYLLPRGAKDRYWAQYLAQTNHTVIFWESDVGRTAFIRRLDQIVKQNQIGILHVHFGNVLNAEIYSMLNPNVQVMIHLHSDFSAGEKTVKDKFIDFVVYRLMSKRIRYLSVSKDFLKYNKEKTTWVPNALATERIPCEHKTGLELRKELNIGENDVLCELFGWSPNIKGVDIAVQAVKLVNEQMKRKVSLAIICGREYTPDKMKQYILEKIGIQPDAPYLLYLQPIEDVFCYHEAADLVISASRSEGFPYSILEMLSIGKPCVVSDIPGTNWAEEYPITFPFESENVVGCAEAIAEAIMKTAECPSEDVKKSIGEQYSIERWAQTVMNCYQAGNR